MERPSVGRRALSSPIRLGWKQRFLLLLLGVALAGALELGLRLLGFGGRAPLLNPLHLAASGGQIYEVHPRAAEIFFSRSAPGGKEMVGSHRRELVILPKPAGTVRVLYVGASTVEGFPMPRNLTSARFLQAMLEHLLPGRRVEVINLGVTAVASFPIRKLGAEALATMDPDLLLIYEAHNELFGASGVASYQFMGRNAGMMQAIFSIRQLALLQAVEEMGAGLRRRPPGPRSELIRFMAAVDEIPPDGALHAAARRTLAANFRALIRVAGSRAIPVVLATVASNERDVAPMASSLEDLAAGRRQQWEQGLAEAVRRGERAPGSNLAALARLVAAAPHHAGGAYAEAQALEAAGRPTDAAELFRRARDLDATPWRAARDKNRLLRRLAADEGIALADCEAAFAAASRWSGAGDATTWDLFADHLHPSLRGQALLARTFLDAIVSHRLLPVAAERLATLADWRELALRLGANPLERFLLMHKMAALFKVPPIGSNNAAAAARYATMVSRIRADSDPIDREAIRLWERASAEAGFAMPISYFGGVAALHAGQHQRAGAYLHAAVENAFPFSDERCAAELLALLNSLTAGEAPSATRDRLDAALATAEQVATLPSQPTSLLARTLAGLLVLRDDAVRSARYAAISEQRRAAAPPWERAFLREVPQPGQLVGLASALRPRRAAAAAGR